MTTSTTFGPRPVVGQRSSEPLDLAEARAYSAAVVKLILLGNEILDAAQTAPTINVTRKRIYRQVPVRVQWSWHYYASETPDGTQWDNDSIVTLRTLLRRHYGKTVVINETWKNGGVS